MKKKRVKGRATKLLPWRIDLPHLVGHFTSPSEASSMYAGVERKEVVKTCKREKTKLSDFPKRKKGHL